MLFVADIKFHLHHPCPKCHSIRRKWMYFFYSHSYHNHCTRFDRILRVSKDSWARWKICATTIAPLSIDLLHFSADTCWWSRWRFETILVMGSLYVACWRWSRGVWSHFSLLQKEQTPSPTRMRSSRRPKHRLPSNTECPWQSRANRKATFLFSFSAGSPLTRAALRIPSLQS